MDIPIEKPIENVEEDSFITQLIESGTILPAPSPENRRAHANHVRCERVVDEGLKSHPLASFIYAALRDANCGVTRSFIKCFPCLTPARGFYSAGHGIIMCENVIAEDTRMQETLTHELTHAYDYCTTEFDFNNCVHQACTEIRASNLSGECHLRRQMHGGQIKRLRRHHPECVKQRASLSISSRPQCQGRVQESIATAWPHCSVDTKPFDVIP